jgi:hypothetical protein
MNPTLQKRAILLSIILLIILTAGSIFLYLRYTDTAEHYTAYLYQNGTLLETIDLSTVTEEYSLTIISETGGRNQILVQPGAISVTDADCPDLICVHQGTIRNNLLPITCLPHGLVIELKPKHTNIDTITY